MDSPNAISGDSDGITRTQLTDDEFISYSGFSNDIYKVIVLQNINKTAGQTEDVISYVPTSRTSPHHFLRVESDNTYVIGNPHPTSGGSDNDHTVAGSGGNILYEAGDTVIISPARLTDSNNGVEFNVVIRRSNGTFVQANTFSFTDTLSLSELRLNTLYFQTSNANRTEPRNITSAVILEHSGTDYIRHSSLQDFDFTDPLLGKYIIGEGSETLTITDKLRLTDNLQISTLTDSMGNNIDFMVGDGAQGPAGPVGPKGDKGDKGDTGEQGPMGEKGDTGDVGPAGPQGIQGEKGDPGDSGGGSTITPRLVDVKVNGLPHADGTMPLTITPDRMGGFNATQFSGQVTMVSNITSVGTGTGIETDTFNYSQIGTRVVHTAYEVRSFTGSGNFRGIYIWRDGNNLLVDYSR